MARWMGADIVVDRWGDDPDPRLEHADSGRCECQEPNVRVARTTITVAEDLSK